MLNPKRFMLTILVGVGLAATTASAQQDLIEVLRADARADKVAVVTESMNLDDDEGERFWPIYREYELELSKIGDRRIALLKRYAESYETLKNNDVKKLAKEWFSLQEDHLKLKKKYYDRMEKALSASIAARFIQVEHQIGLLVDLGMVETTPLVNPVKK